MTKNHIAWKIRTGTTCVTAVGALLLTCPATGTETMNKRPKEADGLLHRRSMRVRLFGPLSSFASVSS